MEELKPCPLCGGKMVISKSHCITAEGERTGYSGYCVSCGMRTRTKFSEAEAIADTNRRATTEKRAGTVQGLSGRIFTPASRKELNFMEPLTDVLIYLSIIGCAAVVIGALGYGIWQLIGKIRDLGREDERVLANRQYMWGRLGNGL